MTTLDIRGLTARAIKWGCVIKADVKQVYDTYFQEGTKAHDDLEKAYYAFHIPHFRLDPGAHDFENEERSASCRWCGRSRQEVRWDVLPAECGDRPSVGEVAPTILAEETKYLALLSKAEIEIPKLVKDNKLTGDLLCKLQTTYGYDPDSVASALDIEVEPYMADFEIAMNNHRLKSGVFNKGEVCGPRTTISNNTNSLGVNTDSRS